MKLKRRSLLLALGAITLPGTAGAIACPALAGSRGDINLVGSSLPAIQHMAHAAEACSRSGLKVAFKVTPQARTEVERAFGSGGPSSFDAAVISAGVFSNLYSRRQLAEMTALVEKYASRYKLEERMLVRVNGEVMALAFMQNTQNLVYRQDLLDRHRIAVPTNYAQMLQAAGKIRVAEPNVVFPIAQGFGKGFDASVEFTNILASLGGRFFEPGSAQPAFHGALGVKAVEVMQSVLPFMSPNALAMSTDDVMNQLQQGKSAMGVLWASRASRMDDPVASKVVGKMAFAAAPSAIAGAPTAAHLWWDGVAMPRNFAGGDTRREAVFQVLMEMLSEETVRTGNDLAVWVRSVYQPGRFGTGVALAQTAGAKAWPAEPFFSLAVGEVGKVLPDALKAERPVADVLAAAAQAYRRAAVEKGFIRSIR